MNLRQHHARPKVGTEPFDVQMDTLRDFAWRRGEIDQDVVYAVCELYNRYTEIIAIARELVAEGHLAARAILVTDERRP